MKEIVRLNEKQISYNGLLFHKDVQNYYRNRKGGEVRLLHRYVYQTENNVELAKGYVVHHIDDNKENNNISNLQYMTLSEHMSLHASTRSDATKLKMSISQKKVMTQKKKDNISRIHKGKVVSQDVKDKLSKSLTKYQDGDVWRRPNGFYCTKINGQIIKIAKRDFDKYELV